MAEPRDERVIDMTALKGLAHPLRVQLLEALAAYGPSTASALAERFGESSGATSYHLRQLQRHGFVREDAGRGVGRERWWERVPQPIRLEMDRDGDPARRAASELVFSEMQRFRNQRLAEYLAHGIEEFGVAWVESSSVRTSNLHLTREQSAALVKELDAVLDGYLQKYRGQQVPGARPVQIHSDVFPLVDGVATPGDVGGSVQSGSK